MKHLAKLLVVIAVLALEAHGQMNCETCHADKAASLKQTPHSVLPPVNDKAPACVSCHGLAEKHPRNPSAGHVMSFDEEPAKAKSAICSSCHADKHVGVGNNHLRAGVACTDCHNVHPKPQSQTQLQNQSVRQWFDKLEFGSSACTGCHIDVRAQFSLNNAHRLEENSVTCVSCHDPHAVTKPLTLGSASHDTCDACHIDKAGPFVFEHAALRVEGCSACHTPHGSANRHLLSHQNVAEVCLGCHAEVPQFHLGFSPVGAPRFGPETVCTNCHSAIHGSNLDRKFLK